MGPQSENPPCDLPAEHRHECPSEPRSEISQLLRRGHGTPSYFNLPPSNEPFRVTERRSIGTPCQPKPVPASFSPTVSHVCGLHPSA